MAVCMAGRVAPPVYMYACIYGWLDTARRSHRGIPVLLLDEASQQLGAARLGGRDLTPMASRAGVYWCRKSPFSP